MPKEITLAGPNIRPLLPGMNDEYGRFVLVLGVKDGLWGYLSSLLTLIKDTHGLVLSARGAYRCQTLLHIKPSRSQAAINNRLGFV